MQADFHPFNRTSKFIGVGFLKYLIALFHKYNWPYEIQDYREWSFAYTDKQIEEIDWGRVIKDPRDSSKWVKFHDYQIEIIKRCLKERHGIISSPTASGKTVTFGGLTKLMNLPTLILFDEIQLVHQTYDEFIKFGFDKKDLGIVQGNNVLKAPITFATVQSRQKLYDYLDAFKVIIQDECHAAKTESFKELYTQFKSSHRFGFSGTPWDVNNPAHAAKVIQYIGPLIYDDKDTRELIDEGYLAKDKFVFVKCDRAKDGEIVWTQSGQDYHNLYRKEIVDNSYRNYLIALICAKHKDDKIVILYENVAAEHGQKIADIVQEYMPDRHIKVLQGKDSVKERKIAIDFFEKNDAGIIIASKIFNKGINIKSVRVGINAAAGKAYIAAVQKAGRMLRKTDGKDEMIYYDILDQNSKVFQRQARQRMKIYKDRGHEVETIDLVRKK